MKKSLQGTYTALVTPFDENLKLNEEMLRKLIQRQLKAGIDGLVILGTTAETPTLTEEEQEQIIKITVKEVNKQVPVIVGTGTYSTEKTIYHSKKAEELGADMLLIVTPYYNKPTSEGIFRHFLWTAKNTSLPLIIYNNEGRTCKNIDTPTLSRLAEIESIVAVKETSENINQMMDVLYATQKVRPEFKVISGDDPITLPLIALGGHGVISVVSNLIPKAMIDLVNAALKGDFKTAKQIHFECLPLFRDAFIETNPIPIKTAMNLSGFNVGDLRLPLCEMSKEHLLKLQKTLKLLTSHIS